MASLDRLGVGEAASARRIACRVGQAEQVVASFDGMSCEAIAKVLYLDDDTKSLARMNRTRHPLSIRANPMAARKWDIAPKMPSWRCSAELRLNLRHAYRDSPLTETHKAYTYFPYARLLGLP